MVSDKNEQTWADRFFRNYPAIGGIMAILALASFFWAWQSGDTVRKWLVAFWSLVPSVYFFFEFHWARIRKEPLDLAKIKESQELARAIWAGVVAALSVLYLKGTP